VLNLLRGGSIGQALGKPAEVNRDTLLKCGWHTEEMIQKRKASMIRMGKDLGPHREVKAGGRKKHRRMKRICVLSILLSLATGAAAGEYYIVQDASTRQCAIVEIPPTTTQFVLLEKGKVFSDRDEARAAAGSLSLCSSKTVSGTARAPGLDEVGRTTKLKAGTVASKAAISKHYQSARSRAASAQSRSPGSGAAIAHAQSGGSRHFPSFFSFFR
jgi:hypothetical protein